MLAEVKKEIDIRLFNETVFRIKILPYNLEYNIHTYGDPDYSIKVAFRRLSDGPTIERLQKAWGLAFQECPGKTTPF